MFQDSVFLGVLLSLGAYAIGMFLKRKTGWAIFNPLLVAHPSHHLSGGAPLSAGGIAEEKL